MAEATTSPSLKERLVFLDGVLVHVHDNSSQWVDVQRFTFPASTADHVALELLIKHVRYRQSYASPEFHDARIIHGPYWLEAISTESYSAVPAASAEALIITWANDGAAIADGDRPVFDEQVFGSIRAATSVYQLSDLRSTAEHDWGWVVGFTGFHEFVAIDHDAGRLTLIVASDD